MDEDKGAGIGQPAAGMREYVIEPERKRPVPVYVLAILMLIVAVWMLVGTLVLMPLSQKVLSNPELTKNMKPEQVEKAQAQIELFNKHRGVLVPVQVVISLLYLLLGIGLLLFREWARIGAIVLLILGAAFGLVDLFALHWMAKPGSWGPVVMAAIELLIVYYLTSVGWAFRRGQSPPQSPATAG
jgi:hypothetical protein